MDRLARRDHHHDMRPSLLASHRVRDNWPVTDIWWRDRQKRRTTLGGQLPTLSQRQVTGFIEPSSMGSSDDAYARARQSHAGRTQKDSRVPQAEQVTWRLAYLGKL